MVLRRRSPVAPRGSVMAAPPDVMNAVNEDLAKALAAAPEWNGE